MAKSSYEYVKCFEHEEILLPNTWIVVRIDGRGFTKFCAHHEFVKPNDDRGLGIMVKAASVLMEEHGEIEIAYGQSDEFSFVLRRDTELFGRRRSKIESVFVSQFASAFVLYWKDYFGDKELSRPPSFDARCVCYPSLKNVRDYLSWRQVDCHINNLCNTLFWALAGEGLDSKAAQEKMKGTVSAQKQEMLFERGINYNDLPQQHRKGTTLHRKCALEEGISAVSGLSRGAIRKIRKASKETVIAHVDIIRDGFWKANPQLLL